MSGTARLQALLACCWLAGALGVLAAALHPGPAGTNFMQPDALVHLAVFTPLCLLGAAACGAGAPAALATLLLGAAFEVLQALQSGRVAVWHDLRADALAVLLGWSVWATLGRWTGLPTRIPDPHRHANLFWGLVWMGLQSAVLLLALGPPSPEAGLFPGQDKLQHAVAFAACTMAALAAGVPLWSAILVQALLGLVIEVAQADIPVRSAELADLIADIAGIAGGCLSWCRALRLAPGPSVGGGS